MYRCEICGDVVPANQDRQLIVKTEPYVHPERQLYPHLNMREIYKLVIKGVQVVDPGGVGTRIVREWAVCSFCKQK